MGTRIQFSCVAGEFSTVLKVCASLIVNVTGCGGGGNLLLGSFLTDELFLFFRAGLGMFWGLGRLSEWSRGRGLFGAGRRC